MELISKFRIIFVVQSIIGNITATIGSRARLEGKMDMRILSCVNNCYLIERYVFSATLV